MAAPYGPAKVRKIMPSFITRALHGEPVEVYGDGAQVMDMIYVADVAKVLVAALDELLAGGRPKGIYEAGSGHSTTVADIAALVVDEVDTQTGVYAEIRHLPMRPGETPGVVVQGDPSTLAPLGIDPGEFVPLGEGVARTVEFYRARFA